VLISLLVIGCVELNPGPDNVRYVIHSNKYLCNCKGFYRVNFTGQMREETTIDIVPKIIMEMEKCWKP
jgi:hypothetical protein